VASNLPLYATGDRVRLLYKTNEPEVAFIDSFFERWLGPLVFTGGGGFFLAVLLVMTRHKIRNRRVADQPAA
jgi:hypothetical protein